MDFVADDDDISDNNDEEYDDDADGCVAGASVKGSQLLHISKIFQPGGDAIDLCLKTFLVHNSWREIFVFFLHLIRGGDKCFLLSRLERGRIVFKETRPRQAQGKATGQF